MSTPVTAMPVSALELAMTLQGVHEVVGGHDNPLILAMLQQDNAWPSHDEVAWCSAFVNFVARLLRLPRSKDLRARSWLRVGREVSLREAQPYFDVVIFNRGGPHDPAIIDAPGHVAFFSKLMGGMVEVFGGNQGNAAGFAQYPAADVLGVRRLYG